MAHRQRVRAGTHAAITLILVGLAVLLPGLSVAARINTAIVGLVLLALSAVSPLHGHPHGRPQQSVRGDTPSGAGLMSIRSR